MLVIQSWWCMSNWNGIVMAFMDSPPSTPETAVLVVWWWYGAPYYNTYTILWCTILWVADVTWIDYQITSGHSYYSTAAHCNGTPLSSWLLFLFSRWFPHTLGSHHQLCHHKLGISAAGRRGAGLGFQNENAFIALELSSFSLQYLSNVWLVIVLFQIRIQDSFWYWVFAP